MKAHVEYKILCSYINILFCQISQLWYCIHIYNIAVKPKWEASVVLSTAPVGVNCIQILGKNKSYFECVYCHFRSWLL